MPLPPVGFFLRWNATPELPSIGATIHKAPPVRAAFHRQNPPQDSQGTGAAAFGTGGVRQNPPLPHPRLPALVPLSPCCSGEKQGPGARPLQAQYVLLESCVRLEVRLRCHHPDRHQGRSRRSLRHLPRPLHAL